MYTNSRDEEVRSLKKLWARANIAEELQGRAWGLIGFLSQIGYVVVYSCSGLLADGIGNRLQIGVGRGAAAVLMASGVLLSVMAMAIYPIKAVRKLENGTSNASERFRGDR